MKVEEIRELDADEIESRLDDQRENLMRLRFQVATGELTDPNQLRITRRTIARLLTVLREKKVEGEA